MKTDLLFSSKEMSWRTPRDLFNKIDDVYHFTVDVAASQDNALCDCYLTEEDNALLLDWNGEVCWCNPPYGRSIRDWVRKCYEESRKGATVVMLLFARTDTQWFQDYVVYGDVLFLKGRLRFSSAGVNAPAPSMVLVFGGKRKQFFELCTVLDGVPMLA